MITALLLGILLSPTAYASHSATLVCPRGFTMQTVVDHRTNTEDQQCVDGYGTVVDPVVIPDRDRVQNSRGYAPPPPIYRERREVIVVRDFVPARGRVQGNVGWTDHRGNSYAVAVNTRLPAARNTSHHHHNTRAKPAHVHRVTNGVRCHNQPARRATTASHRH